MPEPPVPPTPPVPLTALLAREDLALRQIAGPPAEDVVVHWVHTSEMADPYPYLLGGELLLSAGVHIPETVGAETVGAETVGAETAGPDTAGSNTAGPDTAGPDTAGSNTAGPDTAGSDTAGAEVVGPDTARTPSPGSVYFDGYVSRIVAAGGAALGFGVAPVHDTVPDGLIAACAAHGLPLLEVPRRTTFSGVARAVWQLMAQARLAELRRVTEAQQGLAAAASRPDPVPAVLRQLAQRLGGWAVLYGPEGAEIAGAGREPGDEVRAALARLAQVVRPADGPAERPAPASAADSAAGARLVAHSLGAGHGFVLGAAAPQRASGDHTVVSVAAVLLSLLTGEQQSGTGAARSSALVRLLLGAPPEEVAALLGEGPWTVVHARPDGDGTPDPVAASALGAALGSALVDPAGDVVRALVPAGRAPAPLPGWTLGVSAAVAPHDWPVADTQAARALARARATRSPLHRHSARPALGGLLPPGEAEAHARALLAPVTAHPALTETLRTWLSLHGSWDRTAVALSVHRNTVRQRVARCATLLEADLDDPDVRMELWFALRHV
ncbi:helix-turn-helix domain-containing protein [Streptomyces sp. NPDC059696]|uniref:helix-turn-helix domain-containing protein n=1 Tax=Streptomyces sp. NPDC059696 TaxID=3346911 RepID=UPI003691BE12